MEEPHGKEAPKKVRYRRILLFLSVLAALGGVLAILAEELYLGVSLICAGAAGAAPSIALLVRK